MGALDILLSLEQGWGLRELLVRFQNVSDGPLHVRLFSPLADVHITEADGSRVSAWQHRYSEVLDAPAGHFRPPMMRLDPGEARTWHVDLFDLYAFRATHRRHNIQVRYSSHTQVWTEGDEASAESNTVQLEFTDEEYPLAIFHYREYLEGRLPRLTWPERLFCCLLWFLPSVREGWRSRRQTREAIEEELLELARVAAK